MLFLRLEEEMFDGNVNQVPAADELDDRPLQQEARGQDGNKTEHKRSQQAVPKGPGSLVPREPLGEQPEHEGVINGKHAFQDDQQEHDANIGGVQFLTEDVDGGERKAVKERHQIWKGRSARSLAAASTRRFPAWARGLSWLFYRPP